MLTVPGLNEDLDHIIDSLPDDVFVVPPHKQYRDSAFSNDPARVSVALRRDRGGVIEAVDSRVGEFELPNIFLHDQDAPRFIITGYSAFTAVMRNTDAFSASRGEAFEAAIGRVIAIMDFAEHARVRTLLNQAFGRGSMPEIEQNLVAPAVSYLVERVQRRFADGKPVEAMRDLAVPLSYIVISGLLGLPSRHLSTLVTRGSDFFASDQPERMRIAAKEISAIFESELADRRVNPRDDLTTWFAGAEVDGERLSDEEVILNGRFLIPAGVETTSRQLVMMIYALLGEPDRFDEICADPSFAAQAVEEVLRWAPIQFVGSAPRVATQGSTIDDVEIPQGSALVMSPGMINRDPARWERAEEFDLHRDRKPHATFGRGFHQCLGMHLARLEMTTLLTELTQRLPTLGLASDSQDIEILGIPTRQPVHGLPLALRTTQPETSMRANNDKRHK